MDRIDRIMAFDNQVVVSVIKINNIVDKLQKIHNLSDNALTALGREIAIGAYISSTLKGENDKFSITINGGGALGNIVVAGDSKCQLRGYVSNPDVQLPKGNIDVGLAVGCNGNITVIKDLGLKEPYVGVSPLISGEIGEDFAYYYLKSEQQPIAISTGVTIEKGKVAGAGAVIIKPLPNCPDHVITVIEDIMTKIKNISILLKDLEPIDIIDKEFGHFDTKSLETCYPKLKCICSKKRMDNIILSLNPSELFEALKTERKMDIHCHFCNTDYTYTADEIIKLRNQDKEDNSV